MKSLNTDLGRRPVKVAAGYVLRPLHAIARAWVSLGSTLAFGGACVVALMLPSFSHADTAPIQRTLSNGMTLIVKPDHRAPTLVHMVWVRVGSMDEVDGTSGVAHVLEHMMFRGSKTLAPGEFSRRVARLGGRENAFTSRDYTGYYQQVPSAHLEQVMRLEADRFSANRWQDDEFWREIAVVKEERRMRTEDNPRARLQETLQALAFVASPVRRPVVGWMSDLDAMKPDDVRAFYHRWYVPGNAAVVVVGDVEVESVVAMAERIYGGVSAGAAPARKPQVEPLQLGRRSFEMRAPAEQAYLSLAFKVPSLLPEAAQSAAERREPLALVVLAAVLDGYSGARLDRALTQGTNRVADAAGASYGLLGRGPQLFVLDAVPAANRTVADAEKALWAELARVVTEGVTDAELARVKTQWIASETYRQDALMAQAQELGRNWVLELPVTFGRQLVQDLRTVTVAELQAVARKYLTEERVTVGVLRPEPTAQKPPGRPAGPATELRH